MKTLILCLLVAAAWAGPVQRATSFDLFTMLENMVEEEGQELIYKVVHTIHPVEEAIKTIKNLVPQLHGKLHEEADQVLAQLHKLGDEVKELLMKKSGGVYFGFDLLNGLTELTGGTKLSTVISLLQLAEKAHKVADDAKGFVPNLQKELTKIQGKIEQHVNELTKHVIKELGIEQFVAHSMVKHIENLLEEVEEKTHVLILDLLHKIEMTIAVVENELPEIYEVVEHRFEEIRHDFHEILDQIKAKIHASHSSIFDIAGTLTDGTSLGTAIKVMSLIDKFNRVCQDIRGFSPKAEILLEHSVKRVADSAQDFFTHSSKILFESQ